MLRTLEVSRLGLEKIFHIFFLLDFDSPFIFRRMVKRTFKSFEAFGFFARLSLVHQRMELLFLPSVTETALFKSFAAFIIACYKSATLPVFAEFSVVSEQIRLSPKILEVVRIDTLSLVVFVVVGTPFGFKVKYVEIEVLVLWQ